MSSSFTQPFITHCLSKDSSIFIRWTYDLTSTNYTYETYIDIHNKTTDVLSRIYIPNINDLSFKIPNLINDNALNKNIYNEIVEDLKILSCYLI